MSVLSVAEMRPGRAPEPESFAAPSLTAVPTVRRRRRGLMAGVIALLLLALGAVLIVNIHVANSQYQVVQMNNTHESLVHENASLTQQVQVLQSPQSLSSSAVTLGMVMPASAGTFELDTAAVLSGAEAASSEERPTNFVSAPSTAGADATAPVDVAERAEGAPGGLLGAGALHTLITGDAGQNSSDENQSGEADRTDPTRGGGTIDAPSLD
ncbi:hypothetical protein [Garicola koreensis]|uniref:Cell division protein FtsL n=1 Tax=Garicola koreensis TaxID=1262554 RepID=A0A7W5XKW4_9MICC|nr:hypothetical protein [Garicola koreensis]MBB3667400.1 hypothetical protein [Garicola koreensis]